MSNRADSEAQTETFTGQAAQYPNMFTHAKSWGLPDSVAIRYQAQSQTYQLSSSAAEGAQVLQFLYRELEGDFILRAHLKLKSDASSGNSSAGWMLRDSFSEAARNLEVGLIDAGELYADSWADADPNHEQTRISDTGAGLVADVIQLERRSDRLIISYAKFGEVFSCTELDQAALPKQLCVGLFLRVSNGAKTLVKFSNVRIVRPAWEGLVPYSDYLGSRLELLTPATGQREIIYSTAKGIEAPNWTPDGKALIYNSGGLLYRFDLESRTNTQIDTGFAVKNNNDHVLSFDGRSLGISHHAEEHEGKSIIYRLPSAGGEPQQLTPSGHSYLHGWSPDGKYIIYTGERDGQFDIYRTTTDGAGEETQLTDNPTLDDGSEYSPCGNYIYFNSVRTGTMELWRMHADGSDQRQLTDDELNNWFAHPTPDGKTLAFLSYLPDIDPSGHPYYQQVYLQTMPAEGGEPTVVAYLYGGQGTINVPCWSPDGKQLAFVSNSIIED